MDNKQGRERDTEFTKDDFWDINMLSPVRRRSRPAATEHTSPAEIEIGVPEDANKYATEDQVIDIIGDENSGEKKDQNVGKIDAKNKDENPNENKDENKDENPNPPKNATPSPNIYHNSTQNKKEGFQNSELIPKRSESDGKRYSDGRRNNNITSKKPSPEREYELSDSLIHRVMVYGWHTNYNYYEQFRRTAAYISSMDGKEVPYVPFFSYMPQYSQLSDSQFAYYLWMRSEIRRGAFPQADYSYILLYLYELINRSDVTPVEETLKIMTDVWLAYRENYPRLDVQLSDWLCDFCLINRIRPPFERLAVIGTDLLRNSTLKEFYIDIGGDENASARLLMKYCSNYDYRKSKFAAGENLELYKKHMVGVLAYVMEGEGAEARFFLHTKLQDSRVLRDAYTGALCSPKIKKRIEIEYCSFSHSHELRFIITDLLKYSENRIRGYLGIKSRLSCSALPDGLKRLADKYFDEALPIKKHTPLSTPAPEYEKFYEPARSELTFEAAAKIEELSWQTTEKLIEAFSDSDTERCQDTITILPESTDPRACDTVGYTDATGVKNEIEDEYNNKFVSEAENKSELQPELQSELQSELQPEPKFNDISENESEFGFESYEKDFLCAILEGDTARQIKIAAEHGKLVDAVADGINEKAVDLFGDILVEDAGDGYAVIEDYIEDAKNIIAAGQKGGTLTVE